MLEMRSRMFRAQLNNGGIRFCKLTGSNRCPDTQHVIQFRLTVGHHT
jgi:hypothetical protein